MAINKKLIHFKNKKNFENEVANENILSTSIVFILDAKEISTHGTVYKTVNWTILKPELIEFSFEGIDGVYQTYYAEEGMTFMEWCDSEYNTTKDDGVPYLTYDDESSYLFWETGGIDYSTIVDKTTVIVNGESYAMSHNM